MTDKMGKKSRRKERPEVENQIKVPVKKEHAIKTDIKRYIPALVILGAVICAVFLIRYVNSLPGEYDGFAQCLTESGVKFYGSYQCSHCLSQKQDFGSSIKYAPYVECGPLTGFTNPECINEGIRSVPQWKFPDGSTLSGKRLLSEIADKSGCIMP